MAHQLRIIVISLVLALGVTASALPGDTAAASTDEPEALELVDMAPEIAEMVEWAVDLFDQAGLDLPPLRYIDHHGDTTPCSGRPGVHRRLGEVNVIEICADAATFPTKVMVLHETAHAWVDHALTDERKAQFQDLRGWEHRRAHDQVAWHENGTEQAAEIMVWGLVDQPMAMLRIDQASCTDLEAGYVTLTGEAPLHGFTDFC